MLKTSQKRYYDTATQTAETTTLTSNVVSYSLNRICRTSMTNFATSTDSIFDFGGFGFLFPESLIHSASVSKRSRIMEMSPSGGDTCSMSGEDSITNVLKRRRSEEHTSELQSHSDLVCRLLLEKKKNKEKMRKSGIVKHK